VLAREIAKAFRVANDLGTCEQALEFLMALGELIEFAADRRLHDSIIAELSNSRGFGVCKAASDNSCVFPAKA